VGVRLVRAGARQKLPMLICNGAKVQLNAGAEAILSLCDGSRTREQLVAEASQSEPNGPLASDINAFLDAARSRGWIVDRSHEH
jgi:pyrroloquinoline quinone biosynthesis protein D